MREIARHNSPIPPYELCAGGIGELGLAVFLYYYEIKQLKKLHLLLESSFLLYYSKFKLVNRN